MRLDSFSSKHGSCSSGNTRRIQITRAVPATPWIREQNRGPARLKDSRIDSSINSRNCFFSVAGIRKRSASNVMKRVRAYLVPWTPAVGKTLARDAAKHRSLPFKPAFPGTSKGAAIRRPSYFPRASRSVQSVDVHLCETLARPI